MSGDIHSPYLAPDDAPGARGQKVVVNGYRVPLLTGYRLPELPDEAHYDIDDRLGIDLAIIDATTVIPWVADAIAIALGYSCHPRPDPSRFLDPPLPHMVERHHYAH